MAAADKACLSEPSGSVAQSSYHETGRGSITVCPFQDSFQAAWDAYAGEHAGATPFHLTAWKRVIERVFGYEARYVMAEEDGKIAGILPLFLVSNWMQGRALISTPFAVYGGICAEDAATEELLCNAACEMARAERVEYLELRTRQSVVTSGFVAKRLYATFDCALGPDPELVFRQLPKDTRYMVRKARKNGLRLVTHPSQLNAFCEIYARNMRRLGTPIFPKRYFRALVEEFGEMVETSVVWQGEIPVAAVLSFRFRDGILPYYAGSLPEGRAVGANDFMYWELIREAYEQGLSRFDFGRSKLGTGSYFFKTQWKMRESPLPYQYYLVRRKTLPDFSPMNARFQLAIRIWRHIPLPLTKLLGPTLVRLFP